MPSSIYAAVIAAVPIFESLTGTAIVVSNDRAGGFDAQYAIRDAVCEKLELSECNLSPGSFRPNALPDGHSYTFSMASGSGARQSVCIVTPPQEGFTPFASYVRVHTGYEFDYDDYGPFYKEMDPEELRTYNLLLQLSRCGRDGAADANLQTERDLAFASIATTLIHGNKDFVAYGGNTAAAMYATGLNSEAARYGNAVAERILMEDFKQQLGGMLQNVRGASAGGPCRISIETDNQPRLPTYHARLHSDIGQFRSCVTDERGRSGIRLTVTDELLYGLAPRFDQGPDDEGMADKGGDRIGGNSTGRLYSNYIESLTWSPFKNFNGSFERGITYSWRTANQIVGIY